MSEENSELGSQKLLETTLREMVASVRIQEMNEGYSPSKIKSKFREIIERRIGDYNK
jgi:hypothetical protein